MKKLKETKENNWILKSNDTNESLIQVKEIADELGISPIIAKLLYNRGYTDVGSAKSFIYMESEMLSSPFLMKDMDAAVERIRRAIDAHERIVIYGDDELCSAFTYAVDSSARNSISFACAVRDIIVYVCSL